MNSHETIVALLLDHGAGQEIRLTSRYTVLMVAAQFGHHKVVGVLLANGTDVKAKIMAGWTALHVAAQNGHEATVRLLLSNVYPYVPKRLYGLGVLTLYHINV